MSSDQTRYQGRTPRQQPSVSANSAQALSPRAREYLLAVPGVVGIGSGQNGRVVVYVEHKVAKDALPPTLEGHPISVENTGVVRVF